jgi:hypothetical protein
MRIAGIAYDPRELQTLQQVLGVMTYLNALKRRRPTRFEIVFEAEPVEE